MNVFKAQQDGKISLTRVMSFIVVVTIMAVFVAWNIKSMVIGGGFVSLGQSEVYLLAIALGAKVAQNIFGEKSSKEAAKKADVQKIPEPIINEPG